MNKLIIIFLMIFCSISSILAVQPIAESIIYTGNVQVKSMLSKSMFYQDTIKTNLTYILENVKQEQNVSFTIKNIPTNVNISLDGKNILINELSNLKFDSNQKHIITFMFQDDIYLRSSTAIKFNPQIYINDYKIKTIEEINLEFIMSSNFKEMLYSNLEYEIIENNNNKIVVFNTKNMGFNELLFTFSNKTTLFLTRNEEIEENLDFKDLVSDIDNIDSQKRKQVGQALFGIQDKSSNKFIILLSVIVFVIISTFGFYKFKKNNI